MVEQLRWDPSRGGGSQKKEERTFLQGVRLCDGRRRQHPGRHGCEVYLITKSLVDQQSTMPTANVVVLAARRAAPRHEFAASTPLPARSVIPRGVQFRVGDSTRPRPRLSLPASKSRRAFGAHLPEKQSTRGGMPMKGAQAGGGEGGGAWRIARAEGGTGGKKKERMSPRGTEEKTSRPNST